MLQVNKVNGMIAIRTTNAQLQMSQPGPDFEMKTIDPELEIQTEHIKIQIDQRQCFNESGLMDNAALRMSISQQGKQAAMDFIARKGSEGEMLSSIEKNINTFAEIAFNNSFDQHEFNIETMPKSRPHIDFIGGNVDIRVVEGRVEINIHPNKPKMEYQPGSVDVSLQRYPELSVHYTEEGFDKKV